MDGTQRIVFERLMTVAQDVATGKYDTDDDFEITHFDLDMEEFLRELHKT